METLSGGNASIIFHNSWFVVSLCMFIALVICIWRYEVMRYKQQSTIKQLYEDYSSVYTEYKKLGVENQMLKKKVDRVSNRKRGSNGKFVKVENK